MQTLSQPLIPASIADSILGISGLQPQIRAHHRIVPSTNTPANFNIVTPADIRSLYNTPSNLTGSGQTIAIIVDGPVSASDLSKYNSLVGTNYTGLYQEIDIGTPGTDLGESNLDVQTVAGIAPSANIRLYAISDLANQSLENALSQVITDVSQNGVRTTVISMSWGLADGLADRSYVLAMDQLFVTASALGITNVASSGDYGAYTDKYGDGKGQAEFPASDPFVTAVGGTTIHTCYPSSPLPLNSNTVLPASSYIGETVYSLYTSTPPSNPYPWASGGGVSTVLTRPTWQIGVGTFLANQTHRCVPDIAAPWGIIVNHNTATDTGSGNATWQATVGAFYTAKDATTGVVQFDGHPTGGTSYAAPVFAGIVALINQNRGSNGPIGFLNPWLYEIGENKDQHAFRDQLGAYSNVCSQYYWHVGQTVSYVNYLNGDDLYSEGSEYDLCTGIGTPDITQLATFLQQGIYAVEPQSQTVTPGATIVFSAFAEISPYELAPATYQWYKNGVAISANDGGTNPQLMRTGTDTQLSNNGDQYYCSVNLENSKLPNPTITTHAATLSVINTTTPGHLVALSCRAQVGTGNNIMVGGVSIAGSGNMPIMIRAVGPTLQSYGVSGVLPDPQLAVFNGSSTQIASNYIWGGGTVLSSAFSKLGMFSLPTNSQDSAILFPNSQATPATSALSPGIYTAQISGHTGDTGVSLLELYDANAAVGTTWTQGMAYLNALSIRNNVGTGSNNLIGGFTITGSTSLTLLIRATGPTLANYGFTTGFLPDPRITLFNTSGTATAFASNEVWNGNPLISQEATALGEFPWQSTSNDSAVLVTLQPGITYTANIDGATGDQGVALLEIYLVQ